MIEMANGESFVLGRVSYEETKPAWLLIKYEYHALYGHGNT